MHHSESLANKANPREIPIRETSFDLHTTTLCVYWIISIIDNILINLFPHQWRNWPLLQHLFYAPLTPSFLNTAIYNSKLMSWYILSICITNLNYSIKLPIDLTWVIHQHHSLIHYIFLINMIHVYLFTKLLTWPCSFLWFISISDMTNIDP